MQILSLKEAAHRLGISLSTLKRLIAAGTIRKVRVSENRVGVIEGDINTLIARLIDQDAA